jgi:hypothetical protein
LEYNLEGALMFLTKAYVSYAEAKAKAQLWRDDHLDSLEEARAKKNKATPDKKCKACKHIEQQCKQTCNVKRIRQKSGKGSVTKLYCTEHNVRTECTKKDTIENACISENTGRFSQTNNTPLMEESIIANLEHLAKTDAKYYIPNGTYWPPTGTDQYMSEFLDKMRMPNSVHVKDQFLHPSHPKNTSKDGDIRRKVLQLKAKDYLLVTIKLLQKVLIWQKYIESSENSRTNMASLPTCGKQSLISKSSRKPEFMMLKRCARSN